MGNAGFSYSPAWYISLAISPSGQPYVAFENGVGLATVMKYDSTHWVKLGNDFSNGLNHYTSLAFAPLGIPYLAFQGYETSGYMLRVVQFDGYQWIDVGSTGVFSDGSPHSICIAFNPSDGQPYIAYRDEVNSGKASVMKFNGISWINVGSRGFSTGEVDDIRIAFDPSDGQCYVAYQDYGDSQHATVMKFTGTNWANVGSAGFSAGKVDYLSLAISPSEGTPYVAYQDFSNSMKLTVMKFMGTGWVNVGIAGFSAGNASPSIAFSPSGQPYVAYSDGGDSGKASVMKFDGVNWVYVGNAGFSAGSSFFVALAFSPTGQPYVAYKDYSMFEEATVMKYDSVYNGFHEPPQVNLHLYPNPALTTISIDAKNIPDKVKCIEITDINGTVVFETQSSENKIILDVDKLPGGMYFLKLKTNYSVFIGKFCKN
ncbi:MAG: T9SS type A sorting domain-containing protein [Bacteroidetes bacterium]|nr:T9SS type A sorting domain-containing protein [Bacteroidota bacterium]